MVIYIEKARPRLSKSWKELNHTKQVVIFYLLTLQNYPRNGSKTKGCALRSQLWLTIR